jgi:hypothetical protein
MADKPNPFDFLKRLPDANLSGAVERADGLMIDGAWCGDHALVNVLYGDKMPGATYTLGIAGRGTLQMTEQDFRDLLSAGLALFEARSPGFNVAAGPTSPSAAAD